MSNPPMNAAGDLPIGRRELIVVSEPPRDRAAAPGAEPLAALASALNRRGARMRPLFGLPPERMRARAVAQGAPPEAAERATRMSRFYVVDAPEEEMDALAEEIAGARGVTGAYVKPAGTTPVAAPPMNAMQPSAASPPSLTPDFTPRQGYLDPAPGGIDARYAWTFPGGMGRDVRIIDLEWGWRFTHEDLIETQGGVVAGSVASDDNHGTAVLGEFSGDRNAFGVTGICPEANVSAVAFSMPSAEAIWIAADRLRSGDFMLLEIHRPGPSSTGVGQYGYIAIEWWPDDYAAIRYAVDKGIVVIEAGGNGYQNLDDPLYGQPQRGFPPDWFNPFDPRNPTSGAVVVGAGAPPPGTHGRDHGPDRSRLDFSNHGSRIDVQGWGREVTTTGYGDLQGGDNPDLWYTDTFSGTSSASPIVVGALGCLQGILRARGAQLLNSPAAIDLLRKTGSPQQDGPNGPRSERIGTRPDLRQLIAML